MLKILLLFFLSFVGFCSLANQHSNQALPTPVELGVFVYQLYDLDSNKGTFSANISYWTKANNEKNLPLNEIEVGEIYTKFPVIQDSNIWTAPIGDDTVFSIQKLGATFLHNYDLRKFPFDKQTLTINFELPENTDKFIIIPDIEANINKKIDLAGWTVNGFHLIVSEQSHETNFGWTLDKRGVAYSRMTVEINVQRNAILLFFKLSLGLFAAVALALLSTLIRTDIEDHFSARIGLIGGSLLAVIVNQQFADAKIGDSTAVTLVDSLHITGTIAILLLFISTIYSRSLSIRESKISAKRHDKVVLVSVSSILVIICSILINLAIYE